MADKINNIQLFDCYTAKILAKLYETFPRKQNVFKDTFISDCDSDLELKEKIDFVCDTLRFLKENGFITYKDYLKADNCNFQDMTLTLKGLSILNSEPQSIKSRETIGDKIVETVKNGAFSTAAELTKQVIIKMIG